MPQTRLVSGFQLTKLGTSVDVLEKGNLPKFEGNRARIGGVREVSVFGGSANLEFSANIKVTLGLESQKNSQKNSKKILV